MDYIFNNQGFDIEIILYNGKNKLSLTKNAFREPTFIEDLFDWPTKGYIVLDNQYEFFRRLPDLATGENPNAFYKFLGNGKDLIKIMIHPKKLIYLYYLSFHFTFLSFLNQTGSPSPSSASVLI